MSLALYRFLNVALLNQSLPDSNNVFCHLMLTLSWNLMCRVSNASSICLSHLKWVDDALCVYFAHQKNDRAGEHPRDPRHIYANPVHPEICAILALGMYLMCFPVPPNSSGTGPLFPGARGAPAERYAKHLRKLSKQHAADLSAHGLCADDIGAHSARKGAATFASSACPSAAAVHLRAGWALGGVQDTYLRYDGAGDQYVGRCVAGLPIMSQEFALLPPHFVHSTNFTSATIKAAVTTCFGPHLPENMVCIAAACLASVVHHHKTGWLRNTLPPTHPLFNTPLFTH
jgi:hypothetical protein